ncbi:RNA polymerase sigma factor [uncultured Tateyamaria sp.]|uniref:RNA polymerase sigma factor n=1 Tax=uncultured Tateyamaria sp. TaxID=455651 RepID=UPI00261E04EC|nr:RNA polymerase sigma factor [uncultured Tateyamaria sp.]
MGTAEQSRLQAELLTACATGDRAAFRRFYDVSSRYVFGVVLGILRDREIASEVAQETYVRIWKRAGHFRADCGNPLSWIGSIARNCAIDRLRSERARGFVQFSDEIPDIGGDPDPAGTTLDTMVIRKLLNELRPEYRQALLLCYFQGYTYIELAGVMDVPVGTAKSWVRRGIAALKEAMI